MTSPEAISQQMAVSLRDSPPTPDRTACWPNEDCFQLRELDFLRKVRILEGEWLGVYQGMLGVFAQGTGAQEILGISRSPAVLYRKLKKMTLVFPLIVRRANAKSDLPSHIEPAQPDRLAQLSRSAYEAVAYAQQLVDPDDFSLPQARLKGYEWFVYELMTFEKLIVQPEARALHEALVELCEVLFKIEDRARNWNELGSSDYFGFSTEFAEALRSEREKGKFRVANVKAQRLIDKFLAVSEDSVTKRFETMRRAADFLHTLANAARRKGGQVGDRATGKETREVVTVLKRLAQGEPLKAIAQVAIDGQVDDAKSLKKYKSLDRMVSRFSKRVAKAVYDQYGPEIDWLDYNHLSYVLNDWPWIDSYRDRPALMEAARRGLPGLRLAWRTPLPAFEVNTMLPESC
jgi:hypothetical protein